MLSPSSVCAGSRNLILDLIEVYREIVGAARDVASRHIMDRLGLEKELRPHMTQYGAVEP